MSHHQRPTAKAMWAITGASLAALLTMDVPWVLVNKNLAYKGLVNGNIKHPVAVAAIWGIILLLEALMVGYGVAQVEGWWQAAVYGAFLGLVIYFVFNGTSLVSFPNWNIKIAFIDTLWGMFLLCVAALAGYAVKQHFESDKTCCQFESHCSSKDTR